ncbi:zinc finger protein 883-like [Centruroides sculpturatus]|uniref:zinc finger protein 883-like n=1 Tax=Centruroides sculpturatus TaxID=218467 RepID=UPI000C6E6D42|nr:zinc finger protein 883-like [Centruroides sculpturatus]
MERKHLCPRCGKTFVREQDFQIHMRSHTGERPFKCNLCEKSFTTNSNLTFHMKVHSNEKPFKCNYNGCEESFKRKNELKQHAFVLHSNQVFSNIPLNDPKLMSCKCIICEKVCQSPAALKAHIRTHTGERPFSCNFCNGTFTTKSSLNRHVKKLHPKKKALSCSEESEKRDNEEAQAAREGGSKKKKLEMDRKHPCPTCGKTFFHQCHLQVHMRIHTKEKPFQCNLCGKSFTQKSHLTTHMKVHSVEKPFRCNYNDCKKSFKRKSQLEQHTYIRHSDHILSNILPNDPRIISRKCNTCSKVCACPAALKTHIRTHTGERPFSCNFCNGTFPTKSSLNRHVKKTHPKKNTLSCSEESTQDVQREQKESLEQPSTSFQIPESIEFEEISSEDNFFTSKESEEFLENVDVNLEIIQLESSSQLDFFPEIDVEENYLECPFCSEQFSDEVSLKEHERNFHPFD